MQPQFSSNFQTFPLSDDEVVARVLAGDTALFEILMRRHNQRIFRIARSIVNREDEAEDVMQDSYVRAFSHLDQYRGPDTFLPWLTKIAVYEALARQKRQQKVVAINPLAQEDEFLPERVDSRTPEDVASSRELGLLLEKAIRILPSNHRLVFVLREVEGMSTAEVASTLDISEPNVKVRLHRARTVLREHIVEQLGAETSQLFLFHLSRCDRVVGGVLARISA